MTIDLSKMRKETGRKTQRKLQRDYSTEVRKDVSMTESKTHRMESEQSLTISLPHEGSSVLKLNPTALSVISLYNELLTIWRTSFDAHMT